MLTIPLPPPLHLTRWKELQAKYAQHQAFLSYLVSTWLNHKDMWADYKRQDYHGGIETNNINESANRVIKRILEGRGDRRVDSLLRCWRDDVLPHYLDKCEEEHVNSVLQVTKQRRELLPAWALGRPWALIQQLLAREKASRGEAIAIVPFLSDAHGVDGVTSSPQHLLL